MRQEFRALSISYKNAALAIREAVALDKTAINNILSTIQDYVDVSEMLILSTCNRTEIYYASSEDLSTELIKLLSVFKNNKKITSYEPLFEKSEEKEAINQLFRVSLGLESLVVGDMQISNQVKHAYQWTADNNLAGHFLHRLLHTIFFASKRVQQETAFRDGAASTSYASVELVEHLTADIKDPKILVLGIGEIGSDVCRTLVDKNIGEVIIANRTFEKAAKLAEECNFEVRAFEEAHALIKECDVVISSIATSEPFINHDLVSSFDNTSFKYFIDLSVPRSVAHDVETIPGMIVYDIDQIQVKTNEVLSKRLDAVPQVEGIIAEMCGSFGNWAKEMEISPTIHKLKDALETIRNEELSRYLKTASKKESELVEKVTKSIMQKIIKLPVLQLKAACKRGEAETLVDVLNDLFDLEKSEAEAKYK